MYLCRVLVQIILLLVYMSLPEEPPAAAPRVQSHRKRKTRRTVGHTDPTLERLEMLIDRLTVWQVIGGHEPTILSPSQWMAWVNRTEKRHIRKGASLSTQASTDNEDEMDWVKKFYTWIVVPHFGAASKFSHSKRHAQAVKMMYNKVFLSGQAEDVDSATITSTTTDSKAALPTRHEEPTVDTKVMSRSKSLRSLPPIPPVDSLHESTAELRNAKQSFQRSRSIVTPLSSSHTTVGFLQGRQVGFSRSVSSVSLTKPSSTVPPPPLGSGGMTVVSGKRKTLVVPYDRLPPPPHPSTFVKPKNPAAQIGKRGEMPTRKTMIKAQSTSTLALATPSKPRHEDRSSFMDGFSPPSSYHAVEPIGLPPRPQLVESVAETPSNEPERRHATEAKFGAHRLAAWESTRQVLFPVSNSKMSRAAMGSRNSSTSRPSGSTDGPSGLSLADYMHDSDSHDGSVGDTEDDEPAHRPSRQGKQYLDTGLDVSSIILFKNVHGDEPAQDPYVQVLAPLTRSATHSAITCIPVLDSAFVNPDGLEHTIAHQRDLYDGLIATSKRAGEAWVSAASHSSSSLPLGGVTSSGGWSDVPLFSPGPGTSDAFYPRDSTCPPCFTPHRDRESETTGAGFQLGDYLVSLHSQRPFTRPLLILEGDKNSTVLRGKLDQAEIRYVRQQVYQTGPRGQLLGDICRLMVNLTAAAAAEAASSNTLSPSSRAVWLVFFAPSSTKAVLDCFTQAGLAGHLPWDPAAARHDSSSNGSLEQTSAGVKFRLASIGETTRDYLIAQGLTVGAVAKEPTPEGVRTALLEAS